MMITNLAGRKEFSAFKGEIERIDLSKIVIDKTSGKIGIKLDNDRTLTIDVSATKVYSALFGDTGMTDNKK